MVCIFLIGKVKAGPAFPHQRLETKVFIDVPLTPANIPCRIYA